jgi:Mrp family chromosome partitioning ATPase
MKATLPRPPGPRTRAKSRPATKKPIAPTMLETKKMTDPSATETGALDASSESLCAPKAGVADSGGSDGVDNVRVTWKDVGRPHRVPGGSKRLLFGNTQIVAAKRTGLTRTDTAWDAEPVDASRHLAALKRAWLLIVAMVLSMTAAVFAISSFLPETYEAKARIVMDDRLGAFDSGDVETVKRRLATVQALLTTRQVLTRAAKRLGNTSPDALDDKVSASVDQAANIVDVTATDDTPGGAAAIANTVSRSFLAMDAAAAQQRLALARAQLLRALGRARGTAERTAIQNRLSELSVSGADAGSELVLARPPAHASSPRPVRNAVFAFFGSIFLAVLAALALGQIAPRITGGRELSMLTGAPIVAAVPAGRHRRSQRSLADAAYRELQRSFALQLPTDVKVVLVAGDLPGQAKSAVAAALARTLAGDGSRTLVVSADLRRPRVHEILGVDRTPGLADVVDRLRHGGDGPEGATLEEAIVPAASGAENLDVLPAGTPAENPSQLLASEAMVELFAELEHSDYRYVVVEGPPLLGAVDGPLVARYAHAVLVVCQLDRLTPANAVELGELLGNLDTQVVGLVALGVQGGSHSLTVTPWPRESHVEA